MSKSDGMNVACVACDSCKLAFPPDLVGPLVMENNTLQVCPVCAITIIRKEHKLPCFSFGQYKNIELLVKAAEFNKNRKLTYNGEQLDKM